MGAACPHATTPCASLLTWPQDCAPLTLLAPNGARFEFRGAVELALGNISEEQLLAPPDAVGDAAATVSRQGLVNQVRARGAVRGRAGVGAWVRT